MRDRNIYTKMKGLLRMLCLALVLLVIAPAVAFATGNLPDSEIQIDMERFRAESMTVSGGNGAVTEEGYVNISVGDSDVSVNMSVTPLEAKTDANALRLVIINNSMCESVSLKYTYIDGEGQLMAGEGVYPIKPDSGISMCEYLLPVDCPDTMTALSVTFAGAEKGRITIVSIGAVSHHTDSREYVGSLTESVFYRRTGKAVFAGNVSYETAVSNHGGLIALYKLDPGESIDDVTIDTPYMACRNMTLNFRFEFEPKNAIEELSRYFAAVITADNRLVPITPGAYLNSGLSGREDGDIGFKGSETDYYAWATESCTSTAIVDVYLDRLTSGSETGYQYILDGTQHYFDRSYVDGLDSALEAYSDIECDVYLRFLIDVDDQRGKRYTSYSGSYGDSSVYSAIDTKKVGVSENLFAAADFIFSRYGEMLDGNLRGAVLGRAADLTDSMSCIDTMPMSDYADMLAGSFIILELAAGKSFDSFEFVLPVSDKLFGKETVITAEGRDGRYPSDLLIKEVFGRLESYGADLSGFYVMLESNHSPLGDGAENKMREDFINAYNFDPMYLLMGELAEQTVGVNKEVMFSYFPDRDITEEDLRVSYVYNYNMLSCNDRARCYVISFGEMDEEYQRAHTSVLRSVFRYIDTSRNGEIGQFALMALGVTDWKTLVPGFDTSLAVRTDLTEKDLMYSREANTRGSYCLWDFRSANGTMNWSASTGCESVSVYTATGNAERALVAYMDSKASAEYGADYGSIIYHAPEALFLKDIHSISFDLFIPKQPDDGIDAEGTAYEVVVRVSGDGNISESKGRVFAGQNATVYANISDVGKVEYIVLSVRSLDTDANVDYELCVNRIFLHSEKYTASELENFVKSGDIGSAPGVSEHVKLDGFLIVSLVVGISVVTVMLIWGIYALRSKDESDT